MSDYGQRVMLLLHRIEEAERLEEVERLRPASDVTVAVQSHVCAVALKKLSDEGQQVILSLLRCHVDAFKQRRPAKPLHQRS